MLPKQKQPVEQDLDNQSDLQQEYNEIQTLLHAERNRNLERRKIQRQLLAETHNHFDDIRSNKVENRAELRKQKSWEDSFKCDGLPHSFQPRAIQWYISKWDFDMEDELQKQIDWSLQSNELSILTHDSSIPDNTLATRKAIRVDRGGQLAKRIEEVEYILEGVRETIHSESDAFTTQEKQIFPALRNRMHKTLTRAINIYTFQLLKNMEKDMEPVKTYDKPETDMFPSKLYGLREKPVEQKVKIDYTSLEHTFDSDNFSFYIWALRDVPQPPRTNRDRFTIRLASFGGEATFSYFPEVKKFAFRTYWTPHDHYSIHSPTYVIEDPPLKVEDLLTSLIEEWFERDHIEQEKIMYLDSKRIELETAIQARNLEQEKRLNARKDELEKQTGGIKKAKRKRHRPKKYEKLTFGDFKMYDSLTEYINIEDRQCMHQLQSMYPHAQARIPGFINLRSHQICGGVFHFEFLPKPTAQTNYLLAQMLRIRSRPSHVSNFQTIKIQSEITSTSPSSASLPSVAGSNRPNVAQPAPTSVSRKSLSVILKERERSPATKRIMGAGPTDAEFVPERASQVTETRENGPDDVLMIGFQIQLPPNVMWLVPPSVCYWEPWEYSEEFEKLPEDTKNFYRNYDEYMEKLRKRLFKNKPVPPPAEKVVPDFGMQNIPKNIDFKQLCRDVIIPALPYHYQTIIDLVVDKKAKQEASRKERIQKGIHESSAPMLMNECRPNADLTPPMPLFVPQERVFSNVRVVSLNVSDGEVDNNQSAKQILSNFEDENEVTAKSKNEFRPPDILFSEFFKQITDQSKLEDMLHNEFGRQTGNVVNIGSASGDNESTAEYKSFIKRSSKRKGKRMKNKRDSYKLKESSGEKAIYDKSQEVLAEHASEEFRGSLMQEYLEHQKGHWSTRKITDQKYNEETRTITFRSHCFGAYALVTPRYQHMPFKSWRMFPHYERHRDVIFFLETSFVNLEIHVSPHGYRLQLPQNSVIPVDANLTPISFYQFKRMLCNIGVNIFPERDAGCYIKDIVEKHLPMEYHTYYVMAWFCRCSQFQHSPWNNLSHRRRVVMKVRNATPETRTIKKDRNDVLITPNECFRVKVKEACSLDLNEVNIEYEPDPPKQEYHPDLFSLLKSEKFIHNFEEFDESSLSLMFNVAKLLWSIRPLSFS